ncbi:MAG: YfcE family phosphodiesterase [Candidatus Hodarchaeota archaeon]
MRILIIGDFHVPDRNKEIPLEIINSVNKEINKQPFDFLACTGDLTRRPNIEPMLNLWSAEKLVVQGNMDYFHSDNDEFFHEATFNTRKFVEGEEVVEIGIIHGHQVRPRGDTMLLSRKASNMDANILISGHTHALSVEIFTDPKSGKKILLLNPGSATGSWSFVASGKPSYLILEIKPASEGLDVSVECHEFEGKKENTWRSYHKFKDASFI